MTVEADYPEQVISICGVSCAGKGTLIDKINLDRDGVRERFGIPGQPDFFASRSESRSGDTVYRVLPKEDPVTKQMFRSPRSNLIVFRWQFKQDAVVDQLLGWFPESRHRAIVLWRPFDELAKDASGIFKKRIPVATPRKLWFGNIVPRFGAKSELHRRGVEITLVDASRPDYPEILWPS